MKWRWEIAICTAVMVGCGGSEDKTAAVVDAGGANVAASSSEATTADEKPTEGDAEPAVVVDEPASLDGGPTVLGFTSELRAEMRAAIKEHQPMADADDVVRDFMDKLGKLAIAMKVQPDANGNSVMPAAQQQQFDQWLASPEGVQEIVNEFDMDLPVWADRLMEQNLAGTISPERKAVLVNFTLAELNHRLSQ